MVYKLYFSKAVYKNKKKLRANTFLEDRIPKEARVKGKGMGKVAGDRLQQPRRTAWPCLLT